MTEICCANCKHVERQKCPGCLWKMGKYTDFRGKHHCYYNHFIPKEDKMAYIPTNIASTTGYCSGKPDKVEYKPTGKALTARQVIAKSEINISETESFMSWLNLRYSMDENIILRPAFLPYALQHDCFRDFLIAGKYIEKVDTWVSPKIGNRFKLWKTEYILYKSKLGTYCYFMPITGETAGVRELNGYDVENINNITKSEFQAICGSIPIDELERI